MVNTPPNSARQLDQFYTNPKVAKTLYKMTKEWLKKENIKPTQWIEPSAGDGAFWKLLPKSKRLGWDLEPKTAGVMRGDFLISATSLKHGVDSDIETGKNEYWVAIGNPPFGKNSAKAVAFFNACALSCQTIAMIFPQTFKKSSVQRRLHPQFHLASEMVLGEQSFIFKNEPYNVPCVFQIWRKQDNKRPTTNATAEHIDFKFVIREKSQFAIQRVGANAGKVKTDLRLISSSSHYFIQASRHVQDILNQYHQQGGWDEVKYCTAGNPSISKSELVAGYHQAQKILLNITP